MRYGWRSTTGIARHLGGRYSYRPVHPVIPHPYHTQQNGKNGCFERAVIQTPIVC